MKLEPIQRKNISESISEQLRRQIFAGQFPPGTRLPPERELAESLGTNRNTLREAIRSLESLGLVKARQGDGVRVTDFRAEGQINLLPFYLVEHRLDDEALALMEDMLQMRRLLLAQAAGRAAERRHPEKIQELRRIFQEQSDPERTDAEKARGDLEFFSCLVDASQSVVMRWLFNSFVPIYNGVLEAIPNLWLLPDNYLEFLDGLIQDIEAERSQEAFKTVQAYFERTDPMVLGVASELAGFIDEPLAQLFERGVPAFLQGDA